MFTLIWLLSFSESLATKWVSLNNESCMIRPTFVVLNLFKLNYYPFKINLNKCSGSCNSVDDLWLLMTVDKHAFRTKQKR